MPVVPLDVQDKINAVMAVDMSKELKMQAVSEILQKYEATLSEEEQKIFETKLETKGQEIQEQIAKEREKTIIQKIAIDNGNIEYKANARSGETSQPVLDG